MASIASRQPRVASVLPSATEILCLLGGGHLLVGRSHEDNYPASITHLPVLTGQKTTFTTAKDVDAQVSQALKEGQSLYTLDVELLKELSPLDVILTQDLCEVCAIDLVTVERVAKELKPPAPAIVSLNPENLEEVLESVLTVGDAVGMRAQAEAAHSGLLARIAKVDAAVAAAAAQGRPKRRVAFIEWSDPVYVGGHWTPQLIQRAGGLHPLNEATEAKGGGAGKSFAVPASAVVESEPELVILCPCGLNLEMTYQEAVRLQGEQWWSSLPAVRAGQVWMVDGDAMFNRPGPRLVDCLEWLAATLLDRPELAPADFPAVQLPAPVKPASSSSASSKKRTAAASEGKAAAASSSEDMEDIEEAHREAVRRGQQTYIDPRTGYTVFTQLAALERGRCCGSGCRHCPYDHVRVPPARKRNLPRPIICDDA